MLRILTGNQHRLFFLIHLAFFQGYFKNNTENITFSKCYVLIYFIVTGLKSDVFLFQGI